MHCPDRTGGRYNSTDLSNYWKQLGLSATPKVSAVSVGMAVTIQPETQTAQLRR